MRAGVPLRFEAGPRAAERQDVSGGAEVLQAALWVQLRGD